MIVAIIVYSCPKCGSKHIVKNGKDYKGNQKYHCHTCNAYGTLPAHQNKVFPIREWVLRTWRERASMRGIERIFGVTRQVLARWLVEKVSKLPELVKTLLPACSDDVLELDELWSFVFKKSNKRWVWIALCRRTRQVVAYFIGDRSETSCQELWNRIPETYRRCCSYSDFWGHIATCSPVLPINVWARKVGKPIMSNGGTILCVNDWLVSSAKPCPFPNVTGSMTWSCAGSFITTISNVPSVQSSHYPYL